MVNMGELVPFLVILSTVSAALSSALGSLTLQVRDKHFSLGVINNTLLAS